VTRRALRPRALALASLCGFVFFCCAAFSSSAQQSSPQPPAIRSTAELVKIDVSVLDKNGDYVGSLEQKDFQVLDNGAERSLAFFAPVEAPAQVLVIVETSPAVYLIHNEHILAAYALLDGLRADDQVALITYDRAPHPLLAFTAEKPALVQALGHIQYTLGSGQLNLYDSVSTAIDWLVPAVGKKAIVLLTTGLDSSSPERYDALLGKLRATDVVIYAVALGGSLRHPAGKKTKAPKGAKSPDTATRSDDPAQNPLSFQKADAALKSLTSVTGGRVFFPESVADFARFYREIASALRHQYALGIEPAHDGQLHALSVEVLENAVKAPSASSVVSKDPKEAYRVFARRGYLAPMAPATAVPSR
jgi:VWFA-related protein